MRQYERYIAIDDVCAWPNLTRLPDGTIVANIFNQPTHLQWEGEVECWASEDDGLNWVLRGVLAPHEPATARANVAAGLARDGSLIVLISGWNNRNPAGHPSGFDEAQVLPILVCRSGDGGRSWRQEADALAMPGGSPEEIVPFGDIVQLADGHLGVCIYCGDPLRKTQNSYFYASADDGETWQVRGTICQGNGDETTPVVLSAGRLLTVSRTVDDEHLQLFGSSDHGATWEDRGAVTLGQQHPGHLLLLKDGRVLLSYGIRNKGLRGVGVRISEDQGATWSPPRIIVAYNSDKYPQPDSGYPSTVELDDGGLVTAYYCSGIPSHDRYHMGVVRWG